MAALQVIFKGPMTLAPAKRVGKVYSTELEGKLLTNLWPNQDHCVMFRKPSP